ncbi:MAG TPA: peptidoglycan-binding protein [Nocardioidaceae bacterium]|nr:peptidoglycan-binding protein [Nocardioidaceae bacterium]
MRRGTRITIAVATALTAVAMGTGAASGMLGLPEFGDADESVRNAAPPAPPPSAEVREPDSTPESSPVPKPEPQPLLERGDQGVKVRALQHRLFQIAWYAPPMTGDFDQATVKAVRGFQRKRGFEVTGEVNRRTWQRLVRMTRRPTGDEMFNRHGPALFAPGDSGPQVREIQARLRQIAWFFGDVSDSYGAQTTAAVKGFQAKRMIPVTGDVDRRTLDLLEGMTSEPTADELANRPPDPAEGAALDPRCTTGRVLCIDKSSNSLRWVVDGDVQMTLDVRFGREGMETREGQFAVSYKSRDHVSSIYDTSMPFAMFFSGGQAVHYSPDFAANGYNGASHGCVNVRDYGAIASLFDQVNVGTKVVVYWS